MKCEFCYKNKTDYFTVNDEPICEECTDNKGYEVCTSCGRYFKFGSSNGSFCSECEDEFD